MRNRSSLIKAAFLFLGFLSIVGGSSQSAVVTPVSLFIYGGNYYGLIGVNPNSSQNAGAISLSMNRTGSFTATIDYGPAVYRLKGQLGTSGDYSMPIPKTNLTLSLTLDTSTANALFNGSITDGVNTSPITAIRAVFDAVRFPAPQKGYYTLVIASDFTKTDDQSPQGHGFGTITLDGSGKGRFAGTLGDGTKVSQNFNLSHDGYWPLYFPAYKHQGYVFGYVLFGGSSPLDLSGNLTWYKPALGDNVLPFGFTVHPTLVGARYTAPAKGTLALALTNGGDNAKFTTNGGLISSSAQTRLLTWQAVDNKIFETFSIGNSFKMNVSPTSGLFTGSFFDSSSDTSKKFSGVLLQKVNIGAGYFLGNLSTTGGVVLSGTSSPPPPAP